MASHSARKRRESKKLAVALPAIPNLGKLSKPRKNNAAAAKTIAAGDIFWDKRKVAAKARQKALYTAAQKEAHPEHHTLTAKQRQWLMKHLPSWSWDSTTKSLVAPSPLLIEHREQLIQAARLPYVTRASLRLSSLNVEQARAIKKSLPHTVQIILVSTDGNQLRVIRHSL